MVGSGSGSGPFGEFVAIEWLQLVAGSPIILSGALLVLAIMKRFTGQADDHGVGAAGVIMMVASGFAAIVYLLGFACIYSGLMWEGAFPHRLPENLLGSVLFFLLGLAVYAFPKVLDRIHALGKPRHPRT